MDKTSRTHSILGPCCSGRGEGRNSRHQAENLEEEGGSHPGGRHPLLLYLFTVTFAKICVLCSCFEYLL